MKVSKRAAEHQINKDEYQAQDDRDIEVPDPGTGMTRASDDVMKKRKIVKARRSAGGAGSTPIAPPTGRFTGMSSTQGDGGTPAKANPFANVSFAGGATPAKPTFSFGAPAPTPAPTPAKPSFDAPPSAKKPKAPSNGFSFGSSTTATEPAPPSFSFGTGSKESNKSNESKALFSSASDSKEALPSFASPPSSKNGSYNKKMKALNKGFFEWVKAAYEGGYLCEDWSEPFKEYQAKVDAIESVEEDEEDDDEAPSSVVDNKEKEPSAKQSDNKFSFGSSAPPASKSDAPKFSFGASTLAPASSKPSESAPSFSFGGAPASNSSAPPTGSFSFGSGSSAPAPAAAAPSFSFGSIPPPKPSTTNTSSNDDDDPTANPDDGKIEEVQQEQNTEEDVLHEVKAKPMKLLESGEWKKYGAGMCRLYKHKTTSKHRLVLRNAIGKVQFNVAISSNMTFNKELKDAKKGKRAFVKFMGIENVEEGPIPIVFEVGPHDIDEFHSKLEAMKE